VHGIRFHPGATEKIGQLRSGDQLSLRLEPENPVDKHAVAIDAEGDPIGYAPRYLARDIARLMKECPSQAVQLVVQKLNKDAPTQQRLLCRMEACWPEGFSPCDSVDYQPIPTLTSA